MTLSLADANRVIAGAIEKANQLGAKMNIAVCDAGGRLLAFQRMDGAMWAGAFGSQGKAMASATLRPSGAGETVRMGGNGGEEGIRTLDRGLPPITV